MTSPIRSLQQTCALQFREEIRSKLHSIRYQSGQEVERVARAIKLHFARYRFEKIECETFRGAAQFAFDDRNIDLKPATRDSISEIFRWIGDLYSCTDPGMHVEPCLRGLNLELTNNIALLSCELSQFNRVQAAQYARCAEMRGELLDGERAARALSEIDDRLACSSDSDLPLHQEMIHFRLEHLRDYNCPIREDRALLAALFASDPHLFRKFHFLMRSSPIACALAIAANHLKFNSYDNPFFDDPQVALAGIEQDSVNFSILSDSLRADPQIARRAVQREGLLLQFAHESLRYSPEFMLLALQSDVNSVPWLVDSVKNRHVEHRELVQIALGRDPSIFRQLKSEFRDDPVLTRAAVDQAPDQLQFASDRLRDDPAFILTLVKRRGSTLQWASSRLINRQSLILEALRDEKLFYDDCEILKGHCGFMLEAVRKEACHFYRANTALRDNRQLAEIAIERDPLALSCASLRLRDTADVVLLAFKKKPHAMIWASHRLRADRDFIMRALEIDNMAYFYSAKELQGEIGITWATHKGAFKRGCRRLLGRVRAYFNPLLRGLRVAAKCLALSRALYFKARTLSQRLGSALQGVLRALARSTRGL